MGFKKIIAVAMTVGIVMSLIPASVMAARPGWDQDGDGYWYYYTSETEYVTGWKKIGSYWYWFNEDGEMACDSWKYIDDTDDEEDNGFYYHFDKNGRMEKNKWIEDKDEGDEGESYWSYLDGSGHSVMGWYKVKGVWYYFDPDDEGYMAHDRWVKAEGQQKWYRLDSNGRYLKNKWYWDGSYWNYLGSDGLTYIGWHKISKKWYYFNDYGEMFISSIKEISGKKYWFESSGAMATGWISYKTIGNTYNWYYADSSGVLYQNKWLKSNVVWYYFDDSCQMVASITDYEIDGKLYDFKDSGACINPYSGRIPDVI